MEVLIIGNGISRLAYIDVIESWDGEVWGCNRAYLDFPEKLTRINGHDDVMHDAIKYREENQHKYEIWGGHLGSNSATEKSFDCPPQFKKDSGITMVAQALHEGNNVSVCGFDLGGPDIHSPGLEKQLKHNWVQRWRKLFEVYDHKRVEFIGYDHKPYLFSNRSSMQYSQRYRNDRPHIIDPDYLETWKKWTGKEYHYLGGEKVKVRYIKNGYIAEVSEAVASNLLNKKKKIVEIVKVVNVEHKNTEKVKTNPKKDK